MECTFFFFDETLDCTVLTVPRVITNRSFTRSLTPTHTVTLRDWRERERERNQVLLWIRTSYPTCCRMLEKKKKKKFTNKLFVQTGSKRKVLLMVLTQSRERERESFLCVWTINSQTRTRTRTRTRTHSVTHSLSLCLSSRPSSVSSFLLFVPL